MKRILSLITVFTLLFTACEGDPGPQGPPGLPGENADEYAAEAFEIVLDFEAENLRFRYKMWSNETALK